MSETKKNLADRKDFQHSVGPEDEIFSHTDHIKKKDTKSWCKGKTGTEHVFLVAPYNDAKNTKYLEDSYILYCQKCGKELEKYIAFPKEWKVKNSEKPDWLVEYLKNNV